MLNLGRPVRTQGARIPINVRGNLKYLFTETSHNSRFRNGMGLYFVRLTIIVQEVYVKNKQIVEGVCASDLNRPGLCNANHDNCILPCNVEQGHSSLTISVSYSLDLSTGIVGGGMLDALNTLIETQLEEVEVSCCQNGVLTTYTCGNTISCDNICGRTIRVSFYLLCHPHS